ncbi:MAG: adenylate kinase [Planctomycetota bacterium]|nr:adenylate kinase [Planctomycetota bacterium]
MSKTVLILLGAPGAGKGTQAARLAQALGLPHISTGDLFRANLAGGTSLGDRARSFMDQGELVPDELVLEMLFDRVAQEDCQSGYLLDGFPRTIAQAEALEARLEGLVPMVIDIQVPDSDIEQRIVGRRMCKECGAIFHLTFNAPAQEGVCNACSGALYQRKDDTAEVVRTRLEEYHQKTAPLIAFYSERGGVSAVDGRQQPDLVFEACVASIQGSGHGSSHGVNS